MKEGTVLVIWRNPDSKDKEKLMATPYHLVPQKYFKPHRYMECQSTLGVPMMGSLEQLLPEAIKQLCDPDRTIATTESPLPVLVVCSGLTEEERMFVEENIEAVVYKSYIKRKYHEAVEVEVEYLAERALKYGFDRPEPLREVYASWRQIKLIFPAMQGISPDSWRLEQSKGDAEDQIH